MRDDREDLERVPLTWKPTDLGYGQLETIRKALEAEVLSPEMRAEALAALRHLYALSEYQGLKILSLNQFVCLDELGEPVTQAHFEALRDRAFGQARYTLSDVREVLQLGPEDRGRFAEALLDPPEMNQALREAFRRRADLLPPYEWGDVDPERDGDPIEQAQRGETLPLAEVQRRVDLDGEGDGDADQG